MTREGNWDGSHRKKLTVLEEEGEKGILQARKKVPLGVCRRQGLWPWSCRCVTLMGGAQEGKSPQGGMVCLGDGAAQEGRQTQRWTPPCVDTRPTTREPAPPPAPTSMFWLWPSPGIGAQPGGGQGWHLYTCIDSFSQSGKTLQGRG